MFTRKPETYDVDETVIDGILSDAGHPLNRIAALVSPGSRVLDIGTGSGLLPLVLRRLGKGAVLDGVEPHPYAAAKARPLYRRLTADIAELPVAGQPPACYDLIVLADVIEHVSDPLVFLREVRQLAGPGTRIVLSVPNVAFGAVRLNLLAGRFTYVDSGLLERTHLRFFTLASLEELVASVDLHIAKLVFLERDITAVEIPVSVLPRLGSARQVFRDPLAWTYQFLLVLSLDAVPTDREWFAAPHTPLARVVIDEVLRGLRARLGR